MVLSSAPLLFPIKTEIQWMLFLGYDTLEAYVSDDCYLGATIGRVANRIKGASFQLNGKTYSFFVVFRNYLLCLAQS